MLSDENRLSAAPLADPSLAAGTAAFVPNGLLLPAGVSAPKPLPNPVPLFAVEEKLKPEAEPNPEVAAGLLVVGAANEKFEDEGVAGEPNPDGG